MIKNKRILLIGFFTIIVLFIFNNHEVKAYTVDSGYCGTDVEWSLESNGTLNITGTGDMYDYNYYDTDDGFEIDQPWFYYEPYITQIAMSNNITSVGDYAFATLYNVNNIKLSSNLRKIGETAFSGCSITNITIPNKVTSIGEMAFFYCKELQRNYIAK